MNENINLVKILKDCPPKTPLYSVIHGDVEFFCIDRNNHTFPIKLFISDTKYYTAVTKEGKYIDNCNGECILFPSKEQRDWSKFTAPWYKKDKFDPKTLKAFDKVLVFDSDRPWTPLLFSYLEYSLNYPRMLCFDFAARKVIPYNKETEHLVGTHDEAPEYYRYWEE